ncbi:MAG TPA: hypothetical protein VLA04_01630 [Verrucomicrobiae bacterium]|nr:hypothetical protein [Verrucomicrobiae bacterium]
MNQFEQSGVTPSPTQEAPAAAPLAQTQREIDEERGRERAQQVAKPIREAGYAVATKVADAKGGVEGALIKGAVAVGRRVAETKSFGDRQKEGLRNWSQEKMSNARERINSGKEAVGGFFKRMGERAKSGMESVKQMPGRLEKFAYRSIGKTERLSVQAKETIKTKGKEFATATSEAVNRAGQKVGESYNAASNTINEGWDTFKRGQADRKIDGKFNPAIDALNDRIEAIMNGTMANAIRENASRNLALAAQSGNFELSNEAMRNWQNVEATMESTVSAALQEALSTHNKLTERAERLRERIGRGRQNAMAEQPVEETESEAIGQVPEMVSQTI